MKQTAVEWLEEQLIKNGELINLDFKQAKQMEKEQIMNAWLITKPTTYNNWRKEFEQYYNETFKTE